MTLRACASGARGSRQCSKSRYKVVVIQGTEGSVRLGRINTWRDAFAVLELFLLRIVL
jgi:hypothetical protein